MDKLEAFPEFSHIGGFLHSIFSLYKVSSELSHLEEANGPFWPLQLFPLTFF